MSSEKREAKSIWSLALNERNRAESDREEALQDSGIVFLGSKNAGKTTVVLRFLEREESPKPTVALEYTFGRKQARGAHLKKNVAHIWELGGGTSLTQLLDAVITEGTIKTLSFAIVLDLSKPEDLYHTLETLLKELRQKISKALADLTAKEPRAAEKLRKNAWRKYGDDHPDKDLLDLFSTPLIIIGSKYDVFQNFDSEKRKVVCKLLRFISHTTGGHLQFYSSKSTGLINRTNALISSLIFHTPLSHVSQFDFGKPLVISSGSDSLGSIGAPPLPGGNIGRINARNPHDLWKQAYLGFFPEGDSPKQQVAEDRFRENQYKESAVDMMRAQKDEELERYRRASERRTRETARQGEVQARRTLNRQVKS
ncbi:cytoplasmic dynein 2 light intermediate chain 1-like [Oscarella lobularis]|uniref:cytoplasmic dynein 2 light intermediate chain 1-like n=1 Tax=Oscarella lobularis TaxID=121494 RepID=UPI00331380F1